MTRKQVIRRIKQLSKKLWRDPLLMHTRTNNPSFLLICAQLLIACKEVPAWPKTPPAVRYLLIYFFVWIFWCFIKVEHTLEPFAFLSLHALVKF